MQLLYSFTVALFLTIALIPLLIRFSAQLQLLDAPTDGRKIHTSAMPRSGGLAIVLGVFLPLLFMLPIEGKFVGLAWGALIIVIFGYMDDRYDLSYQWKFFGQILAVIVALSGGIYIEKVPLMGLDPVSPWLAMPISFIFLLGTINAVNLSDGLDGLAAGTSLLSLALISILALLQESHGIALVALTISGGLLGFLRYNTFPARIFMGDTGSQFLGFAVASLAIMVSQADSSALSPVMPILLLGLPILDTLTVMAIRIKEGRSPFSPDKNHLHHQLMSLGLKHNEAVAVIYVIQVILLASAYLLRFEQDLLLLVFYTLFACSIIGFLYVGHKKKVSDNITDVYVEGRDRRNQLLRKSEWLYQNTPLIIEWCMGVLLLLVAICTAIRAGQAMGEFNLFSLLLPVVLVIIALVFKHYPATIARLCCYTASVFVIYHYAAYASDELMFTAIDGGFITLVLFLMLAIRMTRREDFRLDTQDLLVLIFVLIVPQLPFRSLDENGVGEVCLRLAVLMYSCEFVLSRGKNRFRLLSSLSISSLLIIGLSPLFN